MDPFGHPAGAVARVLHRCGIGQPSLLLVTVMVTVTQSGRLHRDLSVSKITACVVRS
jgi:hypothetical protein